MCVRKGCPDSCRAFLFQDEGCRRALSAMNNAGEPPQTMSELYPSDDAKTILPVSSP